MSPLLKASAALSAALMLGRLLGFAREMLLAARLGTSAEAEVAIVALTLPDYLVGVLFSGGLSAALVPALRRARGDRRPALFRIAATMVVAAACVVGAAVALFPGAVFAVLAPALPAAVAAEWAWVVALAGLAVPVAALSGVTGSWLNVSGRFFAVGLGVAVHNAVLCLALLPGGAPGRVVTLLAFGLLAAALARAALVLAIGRPPLRPALKPPPGTEPELPRLFAAGVLTIGLVFVANLLFRTLAAASGPGELAAFSYALRLFELPVGLLLSPLVTVLLPRLADSAAQEPRLMRRTLAALLALAVSVLIAGQILGEPIARAIYDRGAMSEDGMRRVIEVARWMFWALPFAALGLYGAAVLNARRRTGAVMLNTAAGLVLGGTVAALGAVLPGFVLFHAVTGVLNFLRSEPATLWRR
ncbi:hypothetical protein GE300_13540 [Rhodobacteraceae bacterium 2CG4]|uniref:Peptidoglycan lipid II flippase n=1 Tax=Halovulum marinum TaxID=2662447 RepID=A0A6L5Z3S6_9RHOB|nr:lipid II flippase MurJ [Halovulum marinum]MSU90624.1 hypothetical protein [Halovulum marinum]